MQVRENDGCDLLLKGRVKGGRHKHEDGHSRYSLSSREKKLSAKSRVGEYMYNQPWGTVGCQCGMAREELSIKNKVGEYNIPRRRSREKLSV